MKMMQSAQRPWSVTSEDTTMILHWKYAHNFLNNLEHGIHFGLPIKGANFIMST